METLQSWFTTWVDPRVVGEAVMDWGGRIAGALLIFIVGRLLMRALTNRATAAMRRVGMDDTLSRFLGNLLYIALLILLALSVFKTLGVDTEFVRFPDSPHGLSRVGRTDRRIARLEHILRWFDKYIGRG